MDKQKALNLVAQAVVQYKGTLAEHQSLQEALKVLNELVNPKDKKK